MGVETELAQGSVKAGSEDGSLLLDKETGKINQGKGNNESIKFGSHALDEQVKGESNNASVTNFPKDAVDEWPAPKQIHSFYFTKYRSYEDPKLKLKLEQADKDLQKKSQARSQLIEKLREKRGDRAQVIAQMKSLNEENRQFWNILGEKKKEMEPLQKALGKLKERSVGLCSSEEELNNIIKSLQYRIQHESIPLSEEKQILKEIKQLEGTRKEVIANAAAKAKIQESMGEQDALKDQVKLMGVDMDGVRKEHQVVKVKRKQLEDEKDVIDRVINSLEEELKVITEKREEGYKYLQELRKQREERNACYYINRTMLIKAKDLAVKKDVEALKELCDTEVNKFMSQWSNSKAFRDDYERRILSSLDLRQLSRDGRMRNPDEKPLMSTEATPTEIDSVAKTNVKRSKEDPVSTQNSSTTQKVQKEANGKHQKEEKSKPRGVGATLEPTEFEDRETVSANKVENPEKDRPQKKEVDEVKQREMKREEEMAKAKLAMERKKKLAEKAATKAALKAQKEAEKKLKDREKKAKKKASASTAAVDSEEPTEQVDEEVSEPEKPEERVEDPTPAPSKKWGKENSVRHRTRARGPDSLPKIILKRKKSTNYWMWAAPVAVIVVMLLVLGYNYLL